MKDFQEVLTIEPSYSGVCGIAHVSHGISAIQKSMCSSSSIMLYDILRLKSREMLQGEDPDYSWAVTVMTFYLKLLLGLVSVVLSLCWLVQVVLYMFTNPPISPFLNTFFITLDEVFPLFGTVAFTVFCFYLIGEHSIVPVAFVLQKSWHCIICK